MSQLTGWLGIVGNPDAINALKEKRQQLNTAAKLPSHNNWEIHQTWIHKKHQRNYYYNLYDSNRQQWSARIYHYNSEFNLRVGNVERQFLDPQATQWSHVQNILEAQDLVNKFPLKQCQIYHNHQTSCSISKYNNVIQAWKSSSGKSGCLTRYFMNVKTSNGSKFYVKIYSYPYNRKQELIYCGSGWVVYPPLIPLDY